MCSPPMTTKRGDDVPPPTKETPCELREHGDPATGSGVGVILCHDTFVAIVRRRCQGLDVRWWLSFAGVFVRFVLRCRHNCLLTGK